MINRILGLGIILLVTTQAESAERELQAGKRAFEHCANCHTLSYRMEVRVGPPLYGVVGRDIASIAGFKYSGALRKKEGVWSERELDKFITKPGHAVKGSEMLYRGMMSPHARQDLIAFIKFASTQTTENLEFDTIMIQLSSGNAIEGALMAEPCMTCHTTSGDGSHSIGPNLLGVFGRNIASAAGFEYSQRLIRREGEWNVESLNAFLFESKKFDQGSHLAFHRFKSLKDRSNIIAWLKTLK